MKNTHARTPMILVGLALTSLTLAAPGDALPNLAPPGSEGETIVVRGIIVDEEGKPVVGAEVFAYHADTEGKYHDDAYRGAMLTDASGAYAFETIRPGGYGPAPHVHFIVKSGQREQSATLRLNSAPQPPRTITLRDVEVSEFTFDIRVGS